MSIIIIIIMLLIVAKFIVKCLYQIQALYHLLQALTTVGDAITA